MDSVIFVDFTKGKKVKGWNFNKVYPSVLSKKDKKDEIWISDERLKIPVGAKKVYIKFYLWLIYNNEGNGEGNYTCRVGMVPDVKFLDDKAIEILKESTKDKFMKNPYYYLLHERDYRSIFLEETGVNFSVIDDVREAMKSSINRIEKNLIYYLQGGSSEDKKESGWSVLVRARSGSI